MKKSASLKLIIFSFLLVAGSVAYSAPVIGPGTAIDSTVAGVNNEASEVNSSAVGNSNIASGEFSSAVGSNNKASGVYSSAVGFDNKASGVDSSAIGNQNKAGGRNSSAVGYNNTATEMNSSAFGLSNAATGINSSAVGFNNTATGINSSAIGYQNETSGVISSAFGFRNKASGMNSSAIGYQNEASGENSSTVGLYNKASAKNGSAFGTVNTASGINSSAVGTVNTASGKNSSAVGSQYKVTGEASGAFGVGKATWNNTTKVFDYDYINEGKNSYMFGNYNKIAAGTENNFILGNNVSIGSGINNSVGLGNGSTVSSSNEVSVGSATLKRKITNVADGDVSATSTDAVNGRQLYKAMQNSNENLRNEVNEKIDDVKDEVNHVGSLSAALAGLHPMQYDPKAPTQVMAALGNYKNKQSVAVGLSYYFNDRFMMSAGVAIGSEKRVKSMANVGFTVKLGKGSGVTYEEAPQYTILDEVKRLTVENNKQAKENQELKERVKNLEEKLEMLLKNK
ncbi:YadA-like family protein [Fusobacterium nucleatum]|uniref:YadA-like family protein n=1 Tax=Fusobacterium nucleatum TaxID=851 RepID=UPI0030D0F59B